jgi:putative ATP-dependent endonuclease of OLD family
MATELILLEQEAGQFPLLLIEEPEAHIHPQLQMKFLKFIREEYSGGESPKLQTILSTHSPNLASKAPLESVILMKDGVAYPMRKGATSLDGADYTFLEKFLDVTKANLFFAKAVLIVEGDAENILLPTISELLGRPLENYGVSIVNVGNTAYARYAKIFLRADMDAKPEKWLPIPVACLRDLDLWPEQADKEAFPNIGFKEVKDGNKPFWETRTNTAGEEYGTNPEDKKARLEKFIDEDNGEEQAEFVSQYVKVCVSEKWTFEYCLALSELSSLVYEALKGSNERFADLSVDAKEKAIQLYGMIEKKGGAKTDVAYKLSPILQREFGAVGRKEELKRKLPSYISDALEHVTGAWPDNLDVETERPDMQTAEASREHAAVAMAVAEAPDD